MTAGVYEEEDPLTLFQDVPEDHQPLCIENKSEGGGQILLQEPGQSAMVVCVISYLCGNSNNLYYNWNIQNQVSSKTMSKGSELHSNQHNIIIMINININNMFTNEELGQGFAVPDCSCLL